MSRVASIEALSVGSKSQDWCQIDLGLGTCFLFYYLTIVPFTDKTAGLSEV